MSSGPAENQQFLIVDSRQIINARIFARHPPELLEISRTDVTPRGTAVGWSQVSRGQSPLGNAQLWFLPRSPPTLRVELKHLNDITSALSSPYSPPPSPPLYKHSHTHTPQSPHTQSLNSFQVWVMTLQGSRQGCVFSVPRAAVDNLPGIPTPNVNIEKRHQ